MPNLYHDVAVMRRAYQREPPERIRKVLSGMLPEESRTFDSHPSLRERLRAQNIPTAILQLPPPTRPVSNPQLDAMVDSNVWPFIQSGPPSAAWELLGQEAINIQKYLSDMAASQTQYIVEM